MTILQINKFYYQKGGAERYMLDLVDWFESRGDTVVPFAMQHEKNIETPYAAYFPTFVPTEKVGFGFNAWRTFWRMFNSAEVEKQMNELLKEVAPEIAHLHNIYTQLSPSLLRPLKKQGVPIVMTVHDHHLVSPAYNVWAEDCGPDYRNSSLSYLTLSRFHKDSYIASFAQAASFKYHKMKKSFDKVDLFICPSEYMKHQLVKAGFDNDKLVVNAYGMDPELVEPATDEDQGYLLFVGRLSQEKGVETLIHLAKQIPDVLFKIVGTGPEEEYLHKLGHNLNNVEFMGYRIGEELAELYRGAMAVMLPSRVNEVFPLTILEAMAAGKPVIASEAGGIPEVVHDRMTGFLVRPLDLPAWLEATERLVNDPGLRSRFGRNARTAVNTDFHVDRHRERLLRIYARAQQTE